MQSENSLPEQLSTIAILFIQIAARFRSLCCAKKRILFSLFDYLAVAEKDELVCDPFCLQNVVGDEDNGIVLFQVQQQLFDSARGYRVQR